MVVLIIGVIAVIVTVDIFVIVIVVFVMLLLLLLFFCCYCYYCVCLVLLLVVLVVVFTTPRISNSRSSECEQSAGGRGELNDAGKKLTIPTNKDSKRQYGQTHNNEQ